MLVLLAAGGCSSQPPPRSELLAQSYNDIQQDYLQPMPARAQALATLRELTVIDSALTVDAVGDELVLKHGARPEQYFWAPAATDWRGWGKTAADVTAAAAAASPAIGSLSSDVLDAALIRGTLAVLDPYSRYISPQALSRSLLVEGSDGAELPAIEPPKAVSASAVPRLEPSVRLRMDNGIALAQINRFTASTGKLLRRKLASAAATSVALRGVILDMRDNPGGDIAAAIDVARLFLHRGVIVAFETRDPAAREVVSATRHSGDYGMLPLVVLIDGASASAAEIVAAALQENDRAPIIGSPSFGKGTIQSIFDLANGGELWVTSAYSRAPSGYFLQHHGVLPDICVTLPMIAAGGDASGVARAWRYHDLLATPRAALTEAQWSEARRLCPPASLVAGDDRALQMAMAIIRDQLNARRGG